MMVMVWSELASDSGGIVLFLVWLVIPLLYLVTVGRRYARQCQKNAQVAVWARDEVCLIREEQREGSHDGDAGE
ncbi:YccF domain-containing protein [Saccharothrix sp. HUAS TT1]|uniref:YccF domain-containing protein n=1 Tax=unclassified Saccharothrix TaxID=2593673 RepID=UPI00345C3D87